MRVVVSTLTTTARPPTAGRSFTSRLFRRGRRTLRGRLTALFVLALTVLMIGTGFLIVALQSRSAEAALDASLRHRIDKIAEALANPKGRLPLTESYGQVVSLSGAVMDLSPAIGREEFLLSKSQLPLVIEGGRLRVDKVIPALGGRSTLLAELRNSGADRFIVIVGAPRDQTAATTRRLITTLVFIGVALVSLLGLGGWLLAGAALRPVRRMADRAARISAANLEQRILGPRANEAGDVVHAPSNPSPTHMPAELTHLGMTLDDMLERLDNSFRRERAFVDDASHELRTPLAIVRGELELALMHPGDSVETQATMESSLQQVTRLGALAEDLLVLARAGVDRGTRTMVDAGAVAESLIARMSPQLREGVSIEHEPAKDESGPPALIRPGDLERILTNLITNAARAARSRMRITLSTDDKMTQLTVSDDGPGFAPDILQRAFERFAVGSSSRTNSGTGLGLAIVHALAHSSGGSVMAENGGELGGAIVTVRLPACPPPLPLPLTERTRRLKQTDESGLETS